MLCAHVCSSTRCKGKQDGLGWFSAASWQGTELEPANQLLCQDSQGAVGTHLWTVSTAHSDIWQNGMWMFNLIYHIWYVSWYHISRFFDISTAKWTWQIIFDDCRVENFLVRQIKCNHFLFNSHPHYLCTCYHIFTLLPKTEYLY